LKQHAGDMPHGVVFKELQQLGLVEPATGGFRPTARDYIRSAADPDLVRYAGGALHDHAATIAHNLNGERAEPARFERMATNNALPQRHVQAFRAFLEAEGQAFLEKVDEWLAFRSAAAAQDKSQTKRERTVRTGVGVFLIHGESEGARE
jgi:hypothetical protein